jgi:hypothetical protein
MFNLLAAFAEKKGLKKNASQLNYSKSLIQRQIKASFARIIWKNEGYYFVINEGDICIINTKRILNQY